MFPSGPPLLFVRIFLDQGFISTDGSLPVPLVFAFCGPHHFRFHFAFAFQFPDLLHSLLIAHLLEGRYRCLQIASLLGLVTPHHPNCPSPFTCDRLMRINLQDAFVCGQLLCCALTVGHCQQSPDQIGSYRALIIPVGFFKEINCVCHATAFQQNTSEKQSGFHMARVNPERPLELAFGFNWLPQAVKSLAGLEESFRQRIETVKFVFHSAQRLISCYPAAKQRDDKPIAAVSRVEQAPVYQRLRSQFEFAHDQTHTTMNQNFDHLFLSDDYVTGLGHRCRHYSLCRRKPIPNPVKGVCALMQSFVNGSIHIGCCNAEFRRSVCILGIFPYHTTQ